LNMQVVVTITEKTSGAKATVFISYEILTITYRCITIGST
jgi:hypothetical protein